MSFQVKLSFTTNLLLHAILMEGNLIISLQITGAYTPDLAIYLLKNNLADIFSYVNRCLKHKILHCGIVCNSQISEIS